MHIYINKETEDLLIKLASSGIYKKNTASYVLKYLVEKEIKYTESTLKKIEEQKKREEEIKQKFGSINNIIELAKQDWTNTDINDEENNDDPFYMQEQEYKKRLEEESTEEIYSYDSNDELEMLKLADELEKWKRGRKNEK